MPVEATTLNGGGVLYTNLSAAQTAKAVGAISSLVGSVSPSQVDYYPTNPTPNLLTDITTASSPNIFQLPPNAEGDRIIAVSTGKSETIDLSVAPTDQSYVVIGNNAGDNIILGGQTATLVTGNGADTISMPGGNVRLEQGGGNDTINATGNSTLNQTGTGNLTIDMASGSTLHLGTTDGNDTINATGSATVVGGTGSFTFNGGNGTNTVYVGTGNETLFGGSGASAVNNFYGQYQTNPNGTDSMTGGGSGAINNFIGGQGSDTMVSGAASGATSDTFTFQYESSVSGGSDLIKGFTEGKDQIVLKGYDSNTGIAGYTHSATGTDITLTDGTLITVKGVDLGTENQAVSSGYIVFK